MNERAAIEAEIDKLKYELSVVIPSELKDAMELGDMKENSDFSSILERQYFINVRLNQLSQRLQLYKTIDLSLIPKNVVGVGSIIKVKDLHTKTTKKLKLVFNEISDECSDLYDEITLNSPLGKALINKKVHDVVTVLLPMYNVQYKIMQLQTIHDIIKT